ncbi:hypothetical protein [Desulfosarcina ovata]|uniref:Uncharacterized protein n=2 Tax=Desulfosarcina ovata TaxID=83564 RepID=A0A5K8ADN9_9BACT|nr:hypothetical protein [Desulfosarcina ovata]BBO84158.1 hypothetical protein DSCO28_47240 [Desulfosarcina ovata subsp. sediminis]BBO90669.1 hypothetical protein DSCOOX_38490 [Desulfosarcina ovata subsp. ovata]
MKFVVYLLGFAWVAAGAIAILYTEDYKAYLKSVLTRLDRIWLALVPAVVGLLLLIGAASTSHVGFVGLIGVLGIVKGVLIYFNPRGLFETSQAWLDNLNDQGYRLMGILALIFGTVVISWIK